MYSDISDPTLKKPENKKRKERKEEEDEGIGGLA